MPKPIKVKIFMDAHASAIEAQINAWLDQIGTPVIIKTDTAVTAATEKPGDGPQPCIVVTVWYEPPST